jgi:2,4-dienoyl-CoA reductase-like NADH-dependent reductase (Old Yellow Enzyme family)
MNYRFMSSLFEPYKIGSLEVRNRFIRSATTSYWSNSQGIVRPEIIELYRKLAEGGVGLIIKGHLYVMDKGKAHTGMAGISHDYHIPKLRELTSQVHEHDSKILAQLNYGGINPHRRAGVLDRAGPSRYVWGERETRALSSDEIHEIVEAFGEAAERAMVANFDGVQIHGAHGYLISQFLSRGVNRRTDNYGGSLTKRMRVLIEVYDEIRTRVGNNIPLLLKLNSDDFSKDGLTIQESKKVAEALCKRGLNAIEVSGGGVGKQQDLMHRGRSSDPVLAEASFSGHAQEIREVTQPTSMALVDGIRSLECMETLISKGICDLISISRPFIREPDLVDRLKARQKVATCISCDACLSEDVFGKMMLRCHLD